jgi:citrate/tricarballylate utilization protein
MRCSEAVDTARGAIEICNACRYCDGYCAAFQVMKLRRAFSAADVGYLANLCHNCRNCYYACQYAPPHEFAVNLPASFSRVRAETYQHYAWPRSLAFLFHRNGVFVALVVAGVIALALISVIALQMPRYHVEPFLGSGAFYAVVPKSIMTLVAIGALGLSLKALTVSVGRFWRDIGGRPAKARPSGALWTAIGDVLTLRNLGGGGHGCNDRSESFSRARRYCHHAVFYGLLLCAAATAVAGLYDHILHWPSPYPLSSLPVLWGAAGGSAIVVGASGFVLIKLRGDSDPRAQGPGEPDYTILSLLLLVAGSGLVALAFRETAAMGLLLAVHLGAVLSIFAILPFSRLVHGFYRAAALLRAAMELKGGGRP